MKRICGLQCAGSVALLLIVTGESTAADQLRGRAIAQRWCSECHVVTPGQVRGSDTVPTFAVVDPNDLTREAFRRSWLRRTTPACQTYP